MSASIQFVFKSAPSPPSFTDTAMPCYECSMLDYTSTCQDCSRFTADMSMTPPSSPTSDSVFPFDFTTPLATMAPILEASFSPKYSITSTEPSRLGWPSLEVAKPSTKRSRFTWSEMEFSNGGNTHTPKSSECHFCSMVPYGALCTHCTRIQKSQAIALATPPAAAWPITHTLGDWTGTRAPEEEILRALDAELFEQINVPHELDEWGRRVYNDAGHRILYYQGADGNTVVGYEASFCSSSAVSDYRDDEKPHHCWQAGGSRIYDHAAAGIELSSQQPVHVVDNNNKDDNGAVRAFADPDEKTSVISGYEAWFPASDTTSLCTLRERDANNFEWKQRRMAEFIAEMDARKRVASSRWADVAAWVEGACGAEGDGGSV